MPSALYLLLTGPTPWSDLPRLLRTLPGAPFDPNEAAPGRRQTYDHGAIALADVTLLQGFVERLPKNLVRSSPEETNARALVDLLLAKGADATVQDVLGRHLEDVGPPALRSRLMQARGGDEQHETDRKRLLAIVRHDLVQLMPIQRLRALWDRPLHGPTLFGLPAPLVLLLSAHLWCDPRANDRGSGRGRSSAAKASVGALHELTQWWWDRGPIDDRPAVLALAWAVAHGQASMAAVEVRFRDERGDRATLGHWQKAVQDLWDMGLQRLGPQAWEQAMLAPWDGRWAPLSGDAALWMARAAGAATAAASAVGWALQATARAMGTPLVLHPINGQGLNVDGQSAWLSVCDPVLELGQRHPPDRHRTLWLNAWPPGEKGARLWGTLLAENLLLNPAGQEWAGLLDAWSARTPGGAAALDRWLQSFSDPPDLPTPSSPMRQRVQALAASSRLAGAWIEPAQPRASPRL